MARLRRGWVSPFISRFISRWVPRSARHALTVAAVLAAVLVAVGGIADQLAGRSVLADTDAMVGHGPYASAGWAGSTSANLDLSDIFSSELPAEVLFSESVAAGHPAQWDPYIVGGTPLGSITNNALLSPVSVPYYVLPAWLAPAYQRLAEVVLGLSGCFLFLRRLRLSPPSAIAGGIVYAASAFTVVWLGWPQTRVAAFIPLLFWATERFLQERRFRDAALLGVVTAGLLLGGFPSVEGYACLTVGCYALTRLIALYRHSLRRLFGVGAGLGFGYLAGLGLALFQVLPFAAFYRTWLIEGRGQADTSHLNPVSLVTSFAPWAFGGVGSREPLSYLLDQNPVESLGYLGAASLVLVVVGVAPARRGRALLPSGVWVFFVAATALWLDLVYRGGVLLRLLQHLPVLHALFGANFIGRARSMTGFLLACLAAVGFEVVVRRRSAADVGAGAGAQAGLGAGGARSGWRRWCGPAWAAGVLVVVGVEAVRLIVHGHSLAVAAGSAFSGPGTSAVLVYNHEVRVGLLIGVIAVACVGVVAWIERRERRGLGGTRWAVGRFAAAAAVLFLIAGQGAQFIYRYSPQADKSTFYPVTDTQEYLAAHLGSQRYASTVEGVVQGTDSVYKLRSLNGHSFLNAALVSLVRGIPDDPLPLPTHVAFADDPAQATSPILDRLGVSYFAASPQEQVFGTAVPAVSDGSVLTLQPDVPVSAALPTTGRVRAVGFTPTGTVPGALSVADPASRVEVVVRDAAGNQVAAAERITAGMTSGTEFDVPVAADSVPAGTALTATITLHGSAGVAVRAAGVTGGGTSVALSEIAGVDDGLRLDYAGSAVLYQRLTALPRIRWASAAQVVPDEAERVKLLASGSLPSSTVVLNAPGAATDGLPADMAVTDDGTDSISVTVTGQGAGYLVVADADQAGWSATVDGRKAELVAADQGVVAVAVPAGTHTIRMSYSSPDGGVGGFVSGATAVVLLGGVGIELWRSRRRRASGGSSGAGPAALSDAEASDGERVPTVLRGAL